MSPVETPQAPSRSLLHELALRAERVWDRVYRTVRPGFGQVTIVPYMAHGTPERIVVRGRVLANDPVEPATRVEPVHQRITRMVRRFATDEIPGVTVEITIGEARATAVTDAEGYFRAELTGAHLPHDRAFHPMALRPLDVGDVPVNVQPELAMITTRRARRLIISDIDDTVLRSQAMRASRHYWRTLTGSSWTRQAFPGVAELYAGLQRGPSLDEENPIAYLSASAWNLYDFLMGFIRRSALPVGPLLLQDLGVDEQRFITSRRGEHKHGFVDELLGVHGLPVVLIGDTGQHDPEIYRQVLDEHPGRIEAVLLRHVAGDARRREVEEMFADTGVPIAVAASSVDLSAAAERTGLVGPGWTDRVAAYR